jgi:hypothetical protein
MAEQNQPRVGMERTEKEEETIPAHQIVDRVLRW